VRSISSFQVGICVILNSAVEESYEAAPNISFSIQIASVISFLSFSTVDESSSLSLFEILSSRPPSSVVVVVWSDIFSSSSSKPRDFGNDMAILDIGDCCFDGNDDSIVIYLPCLLLLLLLLLILMRSREEEEGRREKMRK